MKRKYGFVAFLLVGILLAGMGLTGIYVIENEGTKEQELTVVTSFYPMYILTMNIIGDIPGVSLQNLSENQTGCLHDYQLTPEDMKLLSAADVFIINGGGIESFMSEAAENYPELAVISASEDVTLLGTKHDEAENSHGEGNDHVWMNLSEYMTQLQTVEAHLAEIDPAHAAAYEENMKSYLNKLTELNVQAGQIKAMAEGNEVITFHEAYDYVAEEYGLNVVYSMDLDEERHVSSGEMAYVIAAVNAHSIKVILAEELYGKSIGDTIERETNAKVYYLNTLVRGEDQADSYLRGMEENIHLLKVAFAQ